MIKTTTCSFSYEFTKDGYKHEIKEIM